jgi:hypothetical protein
LYTFSIVPYREQSTQPESNVTETTQALRKRQKYSPFQNTNSKGEYVVARADDLLNWARKVMF